MRSAFAVSTDVSLFPPGYAISSNIPPERGGQVVYLGGTVPYTTVELDTDERGFPTGIQLLEPGSVTGTRFFVPNPGIYKFSFNGTLSNLSEFFILRDDANAMHATADTETFQRHLLYYERFIIPTGPNDIPYVAFSGTRTVFLPGNTTLYVVARATRINVIGPTRNVEFPTMMTLSAVDPNNLINIPVTLDFTIEQ